MIGSSFAENWRSDTQHRQMTSRWVDGYLHLLIQIGRSRRIVEWLRDRQETASFGCGTRNRKESQTSREADGCHRQLEERERERECELNKNGFGESIPDGSRPLLVKSRLIDSKSTPNNPPNSRLAGKEPSWRRPKTHLESSRSSCRCSSLYIHLLLENTIDQCIGEWSVDNWS